MRTKRANRIAGMLFALVMVFASVFCNGTVMASTQETGGFQEGTYTGEYEKNVQAMGSNIHYDILLTLAEGSYEYKVDITVSGGMSYTGSENYSGTYTLNGGSLTMAGKLSGGTVGADGKLSITGVLSSFSGAAEDTVELTLDAAAEKYEDVLASGNYVLTADSYFEGAMMKMPAYIVIDAEKDTFSIHPYNDGTPDLETDKGSGSIAFDAATGIYTMTYANGSWAGATTTFTAAAGSVTFTSPLKYGAAQMNTLDENGKFVPYTAKLLADTPAEKYEDVLASGNYVLTADSYFEGAMMKMPAYIVIDAEKDTFSIHPYNDGTPDLETDKGSGSIAFDAATGIYTMTYANGSWAGATTTFTAAAGSVTFTSPLKYGAAQMNTLDENGKFVPYTAKLLADTPVQPEDNWSEPDVTWSEDGKTCTAVFTNTATGEVKTVTVNAVGKVTKPAGSSNMGVTTYTATIVFNGMEYVYTKDVTDVPVTDSQGETSTPSGQEEDAADASPETGENSTVVLWAVLFTGGAGMLAALYARKKCVE